jgi:uncharacterized SAM-binding protein YcdF (DUF218 family)|tara:strand:+ start:652 stop:1395 length:744 start_codon:yes stop_codon:yes gene_type:complete
MNIYFYASKILTPLILPSNFLVFALVVFFYLGVWKSKEKFKKIFCIFFIFFSSIALLPLGKVLIHHVLEKNYKNIKLPKNIDYIFVPSGSRERIVQAIKIKNNYLPKEIKILYSSGNVSLDKKNGKDFESDFVQTIILNSNMKKNDIIFLPNARNTIENFKQLKSYLIKNKNKKTLLVTSAFHMRRSLMIAKKYNIKIYKFPSFFYTSSNAFSLINFYQNTSVQNNLYYFDIFFKEIIGIAVTKIIL